VSSRAATKNNTHRGPRARPLVTGPGMGSDQVFALPAARRLVRLAGSEKLCTSGWVVSQRAEAKVDPQDGAKMKMSGLFGELARASGSVRCVPIPVVFLRSFGLTNVSLVFRRHLKSTRTDAAVKRLVLGKHRQSVLTCAGCEQRILNGEPWRFGGYGGKFICHAECTCNRSDLHSRSPDCTRGVQLLQSWPHRRNSSWARDLDARKVDDSANCLLSDRIFSHLVLEDVALHIVYLQRHLHKMIAQSAACVRQTVTYV
jgi:hypothetical protein